MTLDVKIFATIIAVYVMVVISPGPNFVLVTRYSLRGFTGFAFALTVGFAIGATINATLTMFGLGSIMAANPLFGLVVAVFGGCFLIYLGVGALLPALKARSAAIMSGQRAPLVMEDAAPNPPDPRGPGGVLVAMYKGVLVNLLNPKGIAFFVGLYAPLVASASIATKLAVLATSFLIEIVWYGAVILVLARPRFRSLYTRAAFSIDAIMGGLLVLVGLSILYEASAYLEAP